MAACLSICPAPPAPACCINLLSVFCHLPSLSLYLFPSVCLSLSVACRIDSSLHIFASEIMNSFVIAAGKRESGRERGGRCHRTLQGGDRPKRNRTVQRAIAASNKRHQRRNVGQAACLKLPVTLLKWRRQEEEAATATAIKSIQEKQKETERDRKRVREGGKGVHLRPQLKFYEFSRGFNAVASF